MAEQLPTNIEHPAFTVVKASAIGLGLAGLIALLAWLDSREAARQRTELDPERYPFGDSGAPRRRRRRRSGLGAHRIDRLTGRKAPNWRTGVPEEEYYTQVAPESETEAWYTNERDVPDDKRGAFEKGFEVGRKNVEVVPEVRKAVLDLIEENVDDPDFDKEGAKVRDIVEKDEGALEELCKDEDVAQRAVRKRLIEEPDRDFLDVIMHDNRDKVTGENRGRAWDRAFESREESERQYFYESLDRDDCHGFIEDAKEECESECETKVEEATEKAREEEQQAILNEPPDELLEAIFDPDGEHGDAWQERLDQYVEDHAPKEITESAKFEAGYKAGKRELAHSIRTHTRLLKRKEQEISENVETIKSLRAQLKRRPESGNAPARIEQAVEEGNRALAAGNCVQTWNALVDAQAAAQRLEEAGEERENRAVLARVQGLRSELHRTCVLTPRFAPPTAPGTAPAVDPFAPPAPPDVEAETEAGRRVARAVEEQERITPGRFERLEVEGPRRGRKRKPCYRGVCS